MKYRKCPKLPIIAAVLWILLACDRSTPLGLYKPRSTQEQAIKSLLLEFQDGVLNRDADKVMALLHEQASIMIDRKYLSKAAYAGILPKRLAENNLMALGMPRMTVSGDCAEVKIYMTRGENSFLMTFNMKLENGSWYILGWEY